MIHVFAKRLGSYLLARVNGCASRVGIQLLSSSWHSKLSGHFALGNAYLGYVQFMEPRLGDAELGMHSQRGQDALAFFASKMRRDGYFIEIGAADGLTGSNTYSLEKIGWKGLLVEPAKIWHNKLHDCRKSNIETKAVWQTSGEWLDFIEQGELSTLKMKAAGDYHRRSRVASYRVETISVQDLFKKWKVPTRVDFLSIDTEGSEVEILRGIDFTRFRFEFICVEHNYTAAQSEIRQILTQAGYVPAFVEWSLNDSYFIPSKAVTGT